MIEGRLTFALTLGLPLLVGMAALAAPFRWLRATVSVFLLAATVDAFASVAILPGVRRALEASEAPFAVWSPLGLYGVELSVRTNALGGFLAIPCMLASLAGWVRAYGPPWQDPLGSHVPVGRGPTDMALLASLSAGVWALMAGDLVSMVLGIGGFFVATALALRFAGASNAARWRLVVTGAFSLCLMTCMLLLGKVNGSFAASQLASVSFSDASLAGIVVVAYGVGNAVPFHAWAQALARQPLMPSVAAVGSALSLAMVDVAFVTTGGELANAWRGVLTALGIAAVVGAVLVAWGSSHPRSRLATLAGGRTGLGLLAIASGAPATMSALALLHGVAATGAALLWVAAPGGSGASRDRRFGLVGPRGRTTRAGVEVHVLPAVPSVPPLRGLGGVRSVRLSALAARVSVGGSPDLRLDAWRNARPWLVILVVATAAGLPGTVGGLAADTYLSALAAASDAGGWLRVAALVLDTATIGAGGAVLAAGINTALVARMAKSRPPENDFGVWPVPDESWRTRSTFGEVITEFLPWLGVAIGIAAIVAPALLPNTFVSPWFAPISVVVAGTSSPPRLVDAFRIASPDRIVLTIAAAVALYRTQRGDEMLPGPARALLGISVLLFNPVIRAVQLGLGTLRLVRVLAVSLILGWVERTTSIARLVEERYATAVAVVVVIVLLYSVGR